MSPTLRLCSKIIRGGRYAGRSPRLGAGLLCTCVASSAAGAELFHSYRPVRQFVLPAGAEVFDALPDGRIIALSGANVHVETGAQSGNFALSGGLPAADMAPFGAAFLRVSPDGLRIAVGNNGGAFSDNYEVGVFEVATLTGSWFAAAHLDAAWFDDSHLALTAGDFVNPSIVTLLNTDSADPGSPENPELISGIGGASGGIAFDVAGNLYTGNGFMFAGPSGTGAVKAFFFADWQAALSGGAALDFEKEGILIVDVLSASPLSFDVEGNLLVGGGDFSSSHDNDFVALLRGANVASALGGAGPINPADALAARHLDPIPANDSNFFTGLSNAALQEVYVRDFGSPTVYVYADAAPIPATSTWSVMVMGLVLLIAATVTLSGETHHFHGTAGPRA